MGPEQVLPLWVKVDLGVMAMKGVLHIPQNFRIGASPLDGLVWFYDISTTVGYLKPNPVVKWLQVLLFNANHSIQHYSFICT